MADEFHTYTWKAGVISCMHPSINRPTNGLIRPPIYLYVYRFIYQPTHPSMHQSSNMVPLLHFSSIYSTVQYCRGTILSLSFCLEFCSRRIKGYYYTPNFDNKERKQNISRDQSAPHRKGRRGGGRETVRQDKS